jgi:hypothetical protein
VVIDIGGAGDYISKVDAKICHIKELYRSVKASLPWKLPKALVKYLVAYTVAQINIQRTSAVNCDVCPKVLFTGLKVNYKKELELGFGDYCEVYDGTDNTSKSRTSPCIALCPSNNATGSWEFLSLTTNKCIQCTQWQKMMTSEVIINMMNSYDPSRDIDDDVNQQQPAEKCVEGMVPLQLVEEVPVQVPGTEIVKDMEVEPVPGSTTNTETDTQNTSIQLVGSVPGA